MKLDYFSKKDRTICALGFVVLFSLSGQAQQLDQNAVADSQTQVVAVTPYAIATRDGNQKFWSKTTWESNSVSGDVTVKTNSFVELATGSSFFANGQWNDSSPAIQITQTGAEATNAQHHVRFLGNINSQGAIDITLPEGDKHLVSTPIGLTFFDTASGKSVMIAEIASSEGQLLQTGNEVLYPAAFTDVSADLLYVNTISGFEQLVVLREQLPSPAEWGLDPETTLLQVITEFINPPIPQITERKVPWGVDQHLDFGLTQMPRGYAFALGSETNTVVVTKQWLNLDGRQCLVESTPYSRLEPLLQELPPPSGQAKLHESPDSVLHKIASGHLLPVRKFAKNKTIEMKLAGIDHSKKGVAIDYTTATSQTNFTFQSDTTYYVSSYVPLSGTTIFEGGTVIKYTNNASAKISLNSFVCKTGPYRMAILTSKDDNTVGDSITGSTGTPTNYQGATYISEGVGAFRYMRFSYAGIGIHGYPDAADGGVWHCQFVKCSTGIDVNETDTELYNVLFCNCNTAVSIDIADFNFVGRHVTADQVTTFFDSPDTTGKLTNSILTGVSNIGGISTLVNCTTNSSSAGFYQTVGAAGYYLCDGSTNRDAGTTNINSTLLTELRSKTTYPPILWTNDFSVSTTLSPQAGRDTSSPDKGYHYDPLDYVVTGRILTSTLTLTNGVALGTYGTSSSAGISLRGGAKLYSTGLATSLNWIVRYNTVQEQGNTNWSASSTAPAFAYTTTSSPKPQAQFSFTAWSLLGKIGNHVSGTKEIVTPFGFKDCQFAGGGLDVSDISIGLTNCLLDRVNSFIGDHQQDPDAFLFNNMIRGGTLTVARADSGIWILKDNLFDQTVISQSGTMTHSNNAYVTGYNRLTPTNANDVVLTNKPSYLTSYLGNYYYPTNDGMLSSLTNAGSRYATNATLYHYTCFTNQQKEASSMVDIGFHYVATDSNGIPIDTDADGTADYLEDLNGNGTLDSGETDWQTLGDMGLRVIITRPRSGAVPLP